MVRAADIINAPDLIPSDAQRLIALVGCSKNKLATRGVPVAARKLYTGTQFRRSLQYAETLTEHVYILSAHYGLIAPDRPITTYEKSLKTMTRAERELWASGVWADMSPGLRLGDHIIFLAGEAYRECLLPRLSGVGVSYSAPLSRWTNGLQMAWLDHQLKIHHGRPRRAGFWE